MRYLNDVSILDTLLETEKKALAKAGSTRLDSFNKNEIEAEFGCEALVEMHFTQGWRHVYASIYRIYTYIFISIYTALHLYTSIHISIYLCIYTCGA